MRRLAPLLVLALGCAGTTSPPATTAQAAETQATGRSVRDLALETYPDAGRHAFAEDLGHVVVIDAWATWCPPCVRSLPLLQTLQEDYAARGVRVYAVSIDDDRPQIPIFLARNKVQLTVLLDPGALLLEQKLALRQMPTTWVVDRTGQVRYTQEMAEDDLRDVRGQLDALLKAP